MDNNYASATIEALKLCVQEQHMIPMTLQFVEPTKHRPGTKNNTFLQKIGLCLWSHINQGACWMTGSDLNNIVKLKILHENTELFRATHPELFTKLMTNKGFKLESKKIFSFCASQRIYLKREIWDENSHECKGLFQNTMCY